MGQFKEYLINDLSESINDKGILKAIFLAGTPGSGKSTVEKELRGQISPKIINTDKFVRDFYGIKKEVYNIISNGDSVPGDVVRKSITLTQNQLYYYIDGMLPLIVDSTSSNPSNLLKRKGILEGLGYDTGMIYVKTSLETALRRNKLRLEKGMGGVPEDFLKATYKKLESMLEYYKENFKYFKVINNDYDNAFDIDFKKVYNETQSFFNSEVKNPIGQNIVDYLKENKLKYLSDVEGNTKEKIKKHTDTWYNS